MTTEQTPNNPKPRKRQYLVTIEGEDMDPEDLQGVVNLALIDGGATVEALPGNVGGMPLLWDVDAPPGTLSVVNYQQPNPYGHVEVVQEDGTSRPVEPGEILTSEGLQRGFTHPQRFSVETEDGGIIGRFRTREEADKAAERWNQQDTVNEVYPATVRDLREETTNAD
ncbi:endolysin [Arthrobacter phage DrYang]|uniref:Endolysin n=1 Tax=Arthrobacter phage DrYang TaxID=2686080 RepID=A0A6B9J7C2_9CAUD|nr:endolysin [Arthrobacter phage DrYang]QGZ17170.1 endolysin [Arthrobacter phage DrYang]